MTKPYIHDLNKFKKPNKTRMKLLAENAGVKYHRRIFYKTKSIVINIRDIFLGFLAAILVITKKW